MIGVVTMQFHREKIESIESIEAVRDGFLFAADHCLDNVRLMGFGLLSSEGLQVLSALIFVQFSLL